MKPTYKQLQSTLAVGSRVIINGGCAPRLYNKRGWVIELRSTFAIVKLDDTSEAVPPAICDIEVTESEHSRGGYLNGWTFKQTAEKNSITYRGKAYDRTEEKDDKGRTIWQFRKEAKGGPAL